MRVPCASEKAEAILAARKDVLAFLQSIGKTDAFDGFTKDDMCGLIRAANEGVQKSLHKQLEETFATEIPF